MQNQSLQKTNIIQDSHVRSSIQLITFITLLVISSQVFATDLLKGTDADIKDIMNGTGKNWLLWIDGAISLGMFAYTKKPMVFFSVLGVLLFITALIKMTAVGP